MFSWLINPAMMWGTLAVASPIIIHLLSKRKYKIVNWAAIEFLLEADRRNRKRIQLENLLLLILRCLAILLLAFLVMRPFVRPTGAFAAVMPTASFERVVLLDDSPSTGAVQDGKSVFHTAVQGLKDFVTDLGQERPGDSFTLILTSRPNERLIAGRPLSPDQVNEIKRTLDALKPSDLSAELTQALTGCESYLAAQHGPGNRLFYVVTDFRAHDWTASAGSDGKQGPAAVLKRIAVKPKTDGAFVIDVGGKNPANLGIAEVHTPEKALAVGVDSVFAVKVFNGRQDVADSVAVHLRVGDTPEQTRTIERIPAGGTEMALFSFRFLEKGSVRVEAGLDNDALSADNKRFFAARVRPGTDVLLVDGKPSVDWGKSETFFLKRALASKGPVASGYVPTVVTGSEFESQQLDKFQAVFICNLYQMSEERTKSLEQWVKDGGGLVIFLGEAIDSDIYNQKLYRGGDGLMPVKLGDVRGDVRFQKYAKLKLVATNRSLLQALEGESNPTLSEMKVFQWWSSTLSDADKARGDTTVLMNLTDDDPTHEPTPFMVEKAMGKGKILLVTTTADATWTNWPGDPSASYVITALETAKYMSKSQADEGEVTLGGPIHYVVDTTKYDVAAKMIKPQQADEAEHHEPVSVTAKTVDNGKTFEVRYPDLSSQDRDEKERSDETSHVGFYRLELTPVADSSHPETVLFSANIDPAEGDLRKAEEADVKRGIGDAKIEFLRDRASLSKSAGSGMELWKPILFALALVLCAEQVLAWTFGRKR